MCEIASEGKGQAVIELRAIEDILKFAIQKEEASYLFYTEMAANANDPLAGQLLADIAQEELRHRHQLQLEIMKMGKVVNDDENWTERTAADYMLEEEVPRDITFAEGLKLAITKEQAAYRLYIDLIRLSQNRETIDTFVELAEEEVRHKLKFEMAYEDYMRQQS